VARNSPGDHALASGDWGILALDDTNDVAFYFEVMRSPASLRPPLALDGFLASAIAFAFLLHTAVLGVAFFATDPPPIDDLATSPDRVARLILDKEWPEKLTPEELEKKKAKGSGERKVREEDVSKRAAGKEGKLGDPHSARKDTVIAKGPRDVIVQKVQATGLLGAMRSTKGDTAISRLLSNDKSADMSMAMAGLAGAQTALGQGSGGLSTRGTGVGGGGTGAGQIFGTGNLQIGGGGNARTPHPGGGAGHVGKELTVNIAPGTGSTDGSLTKEQIYKVVASHAAAIQFCFEKELQRFPHLSGKVVLGWRVELDGRVSAAQVASTTLNNAGTEGCMVRQLKTWVFPKPQGTVAQVTFPFLFKGQ
jgi:hypothetical protein